MNKHSLKDWSNRGAQLAAKRLLIYLNLPPEFKRGTIEETVTISNGTVIKLSEQPITQHNVKRLKAMLTTLSELQRQAHKRRITPEECEHINQELAHYPWITVLRGIDRDGVPDFDHAPAETSTQEEELSRDLASQVVALAQYGVLGRIRRCLHCEKWFVASRRHEVFCCTSHQQAHWRSLPEVKAHRRRYQREYYRNELSPVTSRHARKQQSRRAS